MTQSAEDMMSAISNKLSVLDLCCSDSEKTIHGGREREKQRLDKNIVSRLDEIEDLMLEIQESKIIAGEEQQSIQDWASEIKGKMEPYLKVLDGVKGSLKADFDENQRQLRMASQAEDEERLSRQLKAEKEMDEIRQRTRKESESSTHVSERSKVKLPKLVISKFDGTHLDFVRFWSQFQAEIDNAECSEVTKFSYLKELLKPHVRAAIDGLPFSTDGYTKAKEILRSRYGKESEVINAHVQAVMSLEVINNANTGRIRNFYEKLVTHIQALETMGKLTEINGYVRMILDRLPGIRSDLVRTDDHWQDWKFPELVEALKKWTERNPAIIEDTNRQSDKHEERRRERSYQNSQNGEKKRPCVYCDKAGHKSTECTEVTAVAERKRILSVKKMCFNCTGTSHRASECRYRGCYQCRSKHHTSICDQGKQPSTVSTTMHTGESNKVIYPVVVVTLNGVKCRALLDTGGGSSYASSTLLRVAGSGAIKSEERRIEMMMSVASRKVDLHEVVISSLDEQFKITTTVTKVERKVLLTLPNPRYEEVIRKHEHLKGVVMNDTDLKDELPVHMVLGVSEYTRSKLSEKPRIGQVNEPIAEHTRFGWTISSPGRDVDLEHIYLTRNTHDDCESLYRLDVLGLEDVKEGDQSAVYDEFKEQLERSPEGWYQTGLMWKAGHLPLLNNKAGSKARLSGLLKKLQHKPDLFQQYHEIIQEQIQDGIVERVNSPAIKNEFYLPHRAVVRETAESTKVRIVMDGSARQQNDTPSLNDCLETGPPLQNLIWDILVRNRMKPIAITGDIKQAFLQIRIKEEERDALRFHWIKDIQTREVEVLRFTRALFGLVQSPFLLGGTIEQHLESLKDEYPDVIETLKREMYVDDVISGGDNVDEVESFKTKAIDVFKDAGFTLHKWHSNVPQLESNESESEELTYAKQELGVKREDTAILGVQWDKDNDHLKVVFPVKNNEITKRGIIQYLASVYDPLGLVSPVMLIGKLLYRDVCELKAAWDAPLPQDYVKRWTIWKTKLTEQISVPRSLTSTQSPILDISLHGFGDASKDGTSAALYAIVKQASGTTQALLTSKTRLSKKDHTIPRLELVAAHMTANLLHNARNALQGHPVTRSVCWSDSTTALHWIRGNGNYKQYVNNRVDKIKSKENIACRHVPGEQNPSDIGSRGCLPSKLPEMWWNGPKWLATEEKWPSDIITVATEDTEKEAKVIKEVLAVNIEVDENLVLQKHSFWKSIRIYSWIQRFINNCKRNQIDQRLRGPLTTQETELQVSKMIKREQMKFCEADKFQDDVKKLNLKLDEDGIYRCYGRIYGDYPIYLPPETLLSEKVTMDAHVRTLHGGVAITMTCVRSKYWIPRLRQLTKRIRRGCHGCMRFHAMPLKAPVVGQLPRDRTEGHRAFQVIGIDYAGPITYRKRKKKEGKAYILLYACSLSRALYLDLLPEQTLEEFLKSLKRMIGRKGRPEKIYSDNFSTFKAASTWLRNVRKSEKLNDYLAQHDIKWQFNVSKAPWWGGQFERMVGLVKQALYKIAGSSKLTWSELESLIMDIETTLNNRPMSYVEDDEELPVLTPNSMIFGGDNFIPEEEAEAIEEKDLRKRAKYLRKCKDRVWKRWTDEYLKALRETHNHNEGCSEMQLSVGDVVIIKGDERNRGEWKMGIVEQLHRGRDGVVRSVKLRAGKSFLERAVQHLYPLELSCDRTRKEAPMNVDAREFRPKRDAAAAAALRIRDDADAEVIVE